MRHELGRRSERRTQGTPLGRDRPELPDLDEIRDPRPRRAPVGRRGLVFGHHPVSLREARLTPGCDESPGQESYPLVGPPAHRGVLLRLRQCAGEGFGELTGLLVLPDRWEELGGQSPSTHVRWAPAVHDLPGAVHRSLPGIPGHALDHPPECTAPDGIRWSRSCIPRHLDREHGLLLQDTVAEAGDAVEDGSWIGPHRQLPVGLARWGFRRQQERADSPRQCQLSVPAKFAVRFSGAAEAEAFKRLDRSDVVWIAAGDHRVHSRLLGGPTNERTGRLRRVSSTTPIGDDAVAALDGAVGTRRPAKTDVADHHTGRTFDDRPHAVWHGARCCSGLPRQHVEKVGVRPLRRQGSPKLARRGVTITPARQQRPPGEADEGRGVPSGGAGTPRERH